jgi:hypothetical protein
VGLHEVERATETVPVTMYGVDNVPLSVEEKVVARWSAQAAARDAHTREDILTRAEALAADETRYRASTKPGIKKYITAETINSATGEVLTSRDTHLSVDRARACRRRSQRRCSPRAECVSSAIDTATEAANPPQNSSADSEQPPPA